MESGIGEHGVCVSHSRVSRIFPREHSFDFGSNFENDERDSIAREWAWVGIVVGRIMKTLEGKVTLSFLTVPCPVKKKFRCLDCNHPVFEGRPSDGDME